MYCKYIYIYIYIHVCARRGAAMARGGAPGPAGLRARCAATVYPFSNKGTQRNTLH